MLSCEFSVQNKHFCQSSTCCGRGKNCLCWKWHWTPSQPMASDI